MNLVDKIHKINVQLKTIESSVDILQFQIRRYQYEIKHSLTYHPELKDYFSEATMKEAGYE